MALHPKTWILAQYGGCELSVLGQVFQDSRSSVPGILVKCARFCSRQCLARRIPDKTTLATEVAAWKTTRNDVRSGCRWQFATTDARTKLSHLYPKIERSSRLVSFLSIIEKLSTRFPTIKRIKTLVSSTNLVTCCQVPQIHRHRPLGVQLEIHGRNRYYHRLSKT